MSQQVDDQKRDILKSTFGGGGRGFAEEDDPRGDFNPFAVPQKRPKFGAIGLGALGNVIPPPMPLPAFGGPIAQPNIFGDIDGADERVDQNFSPLSDEE